MVTFKFINLVFIVITSLGLVGCAENTMLSAFFGPEPVLEKNAPFGAISFSDSSRNWQVVSDLPNRVAARTHALSGCRESDCKVLLVFSRGECASLSLDAAKMTSSPYVATSKDAETAINSARQACYSGGGQDCKASPPVCN